MRVITIGDVYGDTGCEAIRKNLSRLKKEYRADMVIVNGENSFTDGRGITPDTADILFAAGADVITGGNHTLRRREVHTLLDDNAFLLRPHNLESDYGGGYCFVDMGKTSAAVINLQGQVFIENPKASNPFVAADKLVDRAVSDGAKNIFVDFHAEATSEKRALGFYLDGKVSAVFGTHTHVLCADAQILPGGTGYITDIGMTGAKQSILGVKKEIIISRFLSGDTSKFESETGNPVIMGCVFETDDANGLCVSTEIINLDV